MTGPLTKSSELCTWRLQGPGWLEGMGLRQCQLHLGTASSHGVHPLVRKLLRNNYRIMHMWPAGTRALQTWQKLLEVAKDADSTLVPPSDALPILANRGPLHTQQITRAPCRALLSCIRRSVQSPEVLMSTANVNRSPVMSCNCMCYSVGHTMQRCHC